MAVIMISELPGAGPEFTDVARQQGLFDKTKSAPGFTGHWSGATDTGYRVFRESPEAHQAWLDSTVKPSLPHRSVTGKHGQLSDRLALARRQQAGNRWPNQLRPPLSGRYCRLFHRWPSTAGHNQASNQ